MAQRGRTCANDAGRFWVHGNATKHMEEYATGMMARLVSLDLVDLASQVQLASLRAAVQSAFRRGITYGQAMRVAGWEHRFEVPRQAGQLPVLTHALPLR